MPDCQAGAFSADGRLLVLTCGDQIQLWDVSQLPAGNPPSLHQSWPGGSARFSPDGRLLAVNNCPQWGDCPEKKVELWDISTISDNHPAQLLHAFPISTTGYSNCAILFTSDSQTLALCETDQEVGLWDTRTHERRGRLASGLQITNLAVNSQGDLLAVTGYDTTDPSRPFYAQIWDLHTGQRLHTLTPADWSRQISFSPDGQYLIESNARTLEWWEARTGQLLTERTLAAPDGFAFSPDGAQLAVARQGRIELWEMNPWRMLRSFCDSCQTDGLELVFSPDGGWLAAYGVYNGWNNPDPLRLWEIGTGQLHLEAEMSDAAAFYPSGLVLGQTLSQAGGFRLVQWTEVNPAAAARPTPAGTPPIVFDITPQTEYVIAPQPPLTLTVQEYPLRSGSLDSLSSSELPGDMECLAMDRALTSWPIAAEWNPSLVSDNQNVDHTLLHYERNTTTTETNRLLRPFGYSLEEASTEAVSGGQAPYRLRKGDQVLEIYGYERMAINSSRTDFAWLAYNENGVGFPHDPRDGWLVRRSGWQPITGVRIGPVYLGDSLLIVRYTDQDEAAVDIDGQTVYTQAMQDSAASQPPFIGYCPVRSFEAGDGHWYLHTLCDVVIDGVSLRQQAGVDEVYGWVRLAGEPFYLFRQNGQVGLNYAGQNLSLTFDEVYHTYFPISTRCRVQDFLYADNIVWFFAQREGSWYIVKVKASAPVVSYASTDVPSGCALLPDRTLHAGANARLWSKPDVTQAEIVGTPAAGETLYVLNGPVSGPVLADGSQKGWFWEVSFQPGGSSAGWIWQSRIQECP